jgi:arsenite methyltransferase
MNQTKTYSVDKQKLEDKVKAMYKAVALDPFADYHFEMGRTLALKLGYSGTELQAVPAEAIDSFAGVGYPFALASIQSGEKVLDLGSGSGMDLFIAAHKAGGSGSATGIDMTDAQLGKSTRLAKEHNFSNVEITKGYMEELPFADGQFDVVISNGVINLSADKATVFSEIARVLKRGGRMAIADIVTESALPESVTCNATLWAACIGGALQQDNYFNHIENAGLKNLQVIHNSSYEFLSKSAQGASRQYGVKSVSIRADKF